MKNTTLDILFSLHEEVAKGLLKKIKSGEATPADYSAATKFLKDNGIQLEQKQDNDPMLILLEDLSNTKQIDYTNENDEEILNNMLGNMVLKEK